ncbi:MAG: glycerol-3-phosphate 1-O-acyltransferase PlsY [Dehalococcoidia bacterium]
MILIIKYVAVALMAYLVGAIPFGLIVSRRLYGIDIRKHGSGNIGATNVFRVLGTKAGLITLVLDLAKSALPVLAAGYIIADDKIFLAGYDIHAQFAQVLAAILVMVGHNWSVYIKFKGGKGVATFVGGMLVINWFVCLVGVLIGGIVILITRYVSLGSILGALGTLLVLSAAVLLTIAAPVYMIYGLLAVGLIVFQHRTNIIRLQAGTESKLGDKSARVLP